MNRLLASLRQAVEALALARRGVELLGFLRRHIEITAILPVLLALLVRELDHGATLSASG